MTDSSSTLATQLADARARVRDARSNLRAAEAELKAAIEAENAADRALLEATLRAEIGR